MLHLETVASSAVFVVLLACILGAGLMICFLVALTLDARKMRAEYAGRHPVIRHLPGVASVDIPYFEIAANSAAHLAIGVVRITTALASNAGRGKAYASADRPQAPPSETPRHDVDFTAARHYRLG